MDAEKSDMDGIKVSEMHVENIDILADLAHGQLEPIENESSEGRLTAKLKAQAVEELLVEDDSPKKL